MICPVCHGARYVIEEIRFDAKTMSYHAKLTAIPCPECGGSGFAYCCEGSERHGQLPDEEIKPDVMSATNLAHKEVAHDIG